MTDNTQQDPTFSLADAAGLDNATPAAEAVESQEQAAPTVAADVLDAAFAGVDQELASVQAALADDAESPVAAVDDGWDESCESSEQMAGAAEAKRSQDSAEQQTSDIADFGEVQSETEAEVAGADVVEAVESTLHQVDEQLAAIQAAVDEPVPADAEAAIADAAGSLETTEVLPDEAALQADLPSSPDVAVETDSVAAPEAVESSANALCAVVAGQAEGSPVDAVGEIAPGDVEADGQPSAVVTIEQEMTAEVAVAEPSVAAPDAQSEVVTEDQDPTPSQDVADADMQSAEVDDQSQVATVEEPAEPPVASPGEADAILAQAATVVEEAPSESVPADAIGTSTAPAAQPETTAVAEENAAGTGAEEVPADAVVVTAEAAPSDTDQQVTPSTEASVAKPSEVSPAEQAAPPPGLVHAMAAPAVRVLMLLDMPFSFLGPAVKGVLGYVAIATTVIAAATWFVLPRFVAPQ